MMRLERWYLLVAFLFLMWAPTVFSASSPDGERAVIEALLEKYILSQGGRERLESITSFEIQGTLNIPSQAIQIEIRQLIQGPDKLFYSHEIPVIGRTETVLNGTRGWESHPITGERPLDNTEIADLLKDTDLQRDLRLYEEYQSIRLGDPETIEGVETTHLIMVDEDGQKEHWYFKENGDLFQKIHIVATGPESEYESRDRFYDFETVEGFRFPRTVRFIHPSYVAELTISKCRVNVKLDPCLFELPGPAWEVKEWP